VVSAGLTISRTTYDGFDHIAQSEKMNDAGVLESTTYKYDPLDRTASKTADGRTTDYTYLGLSSEVLGEEVAGQLTKSYQYSPWGQRLSQITHQADPGAGVEAGESAYYGYNSHTDVETLTDEAGNAVATYGYTAYGNADESEYTGIDKPEAGGPEDTEPYNAYRYNSKRWDAGSGTYDMGFRDYAPGLNRFTTRDMYNGALADMGLGTNSYTGNRYAFGAGNPISMLEIDGHEPRPIHQAASSPNKAGWVAVAPSVENSGLRNILNDVYAKPGTAPAVGSGKAGEALVHELDTGKMTKGKYHHQDVADLIRRMSLLSEADRKALEGGKLNSAEIKALGGAEPLSATERAIMLGEVDELWRAVNHPAPSNSPVLDDLRNRPAVRQTVEGALTKAASAYSLRGVTQTQFSTNAKGRPVVSGSARLPQMIGALGVAGDLLMLGSYAKMSWDMANGDYTSACSEPVAQDVLMGCAAPVPPG
jgi:RHS repeat-associated protein